MSVNLSPVGGVAQQFFDNNGQPLAGGMIYTYAAGTTTPQTVYTSATGTTPHSNPIILNSAGRVPSGEIWLTDSLQYKFVVETSTGILIGTYDNIIGINSNFVNFEAQTEFATATAGQTVFTLSTINYAPGTNTLNVFIDGVKQYVGASYLETNSTTVTFTSGLHVGAQVEFTTAVTLSAGIVAATMVTYTAGFTGAVAQTVQTKLEQYVSVKDFGAVGDGVTNDTAAIQAALNTGKDVYFPGAQAGVVYMFTNLVIPNRTRIWGDGMRQTILRQISGTTGIAISYSNTITSDITDGAPGFDNIAVEVAATCLTGIRISASSANMGSCRSFRLKSRYAETLGSLPYAVVAGQVGFDLVDASGGSMFKWTLDDQCEIRSFDSAIKARGTLGGINEWTVNAWIIDCKVSFNLQGVSAWKTTATHESGVQNARAFLLDLACSNIEIRDSRWELTQSGCYGMEFAATFIGTNIKVFNPAILIAGDGGSIPGRKWTGTIPADFLFQGYYQDLTDGAQRAMIIAPSKNAVAMPNLMRVGGVNRGNGSINFGRDSDNAAISRVYHDGTHFNIMGGNSLRLFGDGLSGANYKIDVTSTGVGFQGNNGIAKPTITGSRSGGAALTNLLTALSNYGLITDGTTT